MKCKKFDCLMDQYYEKNLSTYKMNKMESHIKKCNLCNKKYDKYISLIKNIKGLSDQFKPTNNLWPVIRKKIDKKKKVIENHFYRRVSIAAIAALFIFAFFSFSMFYLINNKNNTGNIDIVMKEFENASKEYLKSKEELLKSLKSEESRLSITTIYEIESNIKLIDDAIEEIKFAIKSDPSNNRLVFNLADAYNKDTALLLKTRDLIINTKQ